MKLYLYNRQKKLKIPGETVKLMEKAAKLVVKTEGFAHPWEVSIELTDNESIREINREHREIDSPTDVLSFPLLEAVDGKPQVLPIDIDPETKRVALGDILISAEKALEQAQNYGHSLERELAFLTVHGMLHLLGYDHMSPEEEKTMFEKQEQVLSSIGLRRE